MPLAVLPMVLVAALCHAAWNARLKDSGNPMVLSARALAWGAALSAPPVAVAWVLHGRPGLPATAWALAGISAAVEVVYFVLLSLAYQRGELSVVYPLARGTAPVLAVLVGVLLLGERLHPLAVAGLLLVIAGIWSVRRPSTTPRVLLPALATGVAIAIYTSLDRVGVRIAAPWLYGWVLWLFAALLANGLSALLHLSERGGGPVRSQAAMVGALMTAAYFIVLVALSIAPLAVVAPVRESAIVLVTGWGIWRLREREGALMRLAGAIAIVLGIAILALA